MGLSLNHLIFVVYFQFSHVKNNIKKEAEGLSFAGELL